MKKYQSLAGSAIAAGIITLIFISGIRIFNHYQIESQSLLGNATVTRVGTNDIYPPAGITGEINPAVTQQNIQKTICVPGWTATIRPPVSYTNHIKKNYLIALQYPDQNLSDYELDHLISLELGGNPTSTNNLWPEKYPVARQKDQVEGYLHRQVCSGNITLAEAQQEISRDWYGVFLTRINQKVGANPLDQFDDPDDQ